MPSLKDLKNISYLTVHISGGYEVLKAIKKESKKINRKLKILGVTVLTSFSNSSIRTVLLEPQDKRLKQIRREHTVLEK